MQSTACVSVHAAIVTAVALIATVTGHCLRVQHKVVVDACVQVQERLRRQRGRRHALYRRSVCMHRGASMR